LPAGCGACCIAPSITTPMPGHADGKGAGEPCANLTADRRCRLWGRAERPGRSAPELRPSEEMCGENRQQAMVWLSALELATRP
jgi:hypothetical protein